MIGRLEYRPGEITESVVLDIDDLVDEWQDEEKVISIVWYYNDLAVEQDTLLLDTPGTYEIEAEITLSNGEEIEGSLTVTIDPAQETKHYFYYLKDHLGSTRAVIDADGNVTESSDYYPFGLQMPGRGFLQGSIATKEGFTGKEQDGETGWQYFGARYYHPALGKWFAVDPLTDDFPSWSSYNYTLNNPLKYNDPNGLWPNLAQLGTIDEVVGVMDDISSETLNEVGRQLNTSIIDKMYNDDPGTPKYLALENTGSEFLQSAYATATTTIDMKHFMYAASKVIYYRGRIGSSIFTGFLTLLMGDVVEADQLITGSYSGNAPEDRISNILGIEFGIRFDANSKKTFKEQLIEFLIEKGVLNNKEELEKRKKTVYKELPKNNEELKEAHRKWKKEGKGVVFNFSRITNYDVENGVPR